MASEPTNAETPRHPRPRTGAGAMTGSIILHAVLLIAAVYWVVATIKPKEKEALTFTSERPSHTANKKAGEDAKFAKRKNMGGAPKAKTITVAGASTVAIPAVAVASLNDTSLGGSMGSGAFGNGFGFGNGGGGGGGGRGMGGGRIKFFGFEGAGNNIIIAIDTSGSMLTNCGEDGIEKLRKEIDKTIDILDSTASFNIICFGQQADACFPVSLAATADNRAKAKAFMKGYYGTGGFGRTRTEKWLTLNKPLEGLQAQLEGENVRFTPLQANSVKGLEGTTGSSRMDLAVIAAMERHASTIFLLSDGQPTTSRNGQPLVQDELIDFLVENRDRLYNKKPLVLNTIYTNKNREEEEFMKNLAKKFGGKHKAVKLD